MQLINMHFLFICFTRFQGKGLKVSKFMAFNKRQNFLWNKKKKGLLNNMLQEYASSSSSSYFLLFLLFFLLPFFYIGNNNNNMKGEYLIFTAIFATSFYNHAKSRDYQLKRWFYCKTWCWWWWWWCSKKMTWYYHFIY